MFKRLFWLTFGYVAGLGSSWWLFRRLQRTVQRYAPAEVRDRVKGSVTGVGKNMRESVDAGRQAMRDREQEIYRDLGR
jgi:hypothetical protein